MSRARRNFCSSGVTCHLSACHLLCERIEAKPTNGGPRRARTTRGPALLTSVSAHAPPTMPRLELIHPVDGVDAWCRSHPRRFAYAFLADDAASERTRLRVEDLRTAAVEARDALAAWARDRREPRVVMLVYPPGLDFLPAMLGAMAAKVVPVPAYPPDPSAPPSKFRAQVRALEEIAERAGATLALTTRAYDAARRCAAARLGVRDLAEALRRGRLRAGNDAGGGPSRTTLEWTSLSALATRSNRKRRLSDDDKGGARCAERCSSKQLRVDGGAADDSGVAFVQFTSGSTSRPRGVAIGHRQLSHNCALIRQQFGVKVDDANVSWLPQYHDMGLVGGYLVPLTIPPEPGAKPAEVTSAFLSPAAFIKDPIVWALAMSKYGATMTQAPDFAYRLCAERFALERFASSSPRLGELNLSKLRRCLNASERIDADTAMIFSRAFEDFGFDVCAMSAGYGLAESVVYVCDGGCSHETVSARRLECDLIAECVRFDSRGLKSFKSFDPDDARRVASCGAPRGDVKVLVVDPQTRLTLPDGRVGEVWIASPSVARGYWNETGPRDDDSPNGPPRDDSSPFGATLAARSTLFRRGFAAEHEKERYLRTGDLAYMRRGELYVVGRLKDLIVIGGRNIAPEDVERTVRETRWSHRGRGVLRARILRPGSIAAFALDTHDEAGNGCNGCNGCNGHVVRESLAVVAEVRDGVELAPADLGVIVDGIIRAVAKAHGVTMPRCHVALLRKNAAPRTTSGKIRRGECARRFAACELDLHPGMGASRLGSSVPPPFPEGSAGLAQTLATRGAAALAESMESALLAHCRETLACPNLSERCGLVARGGMDSFAALRLLRRIEHDIGAALPADAVLREGSTVRSIVRAVLPHVRAAGTAASGSSGSSVSSVSSGSSRSSGSSGATPAVAVAVAELPASMRPDAISGVTLVLCAIAVAVTLRALETTPAVPSGHRGFRPGWLSDDVAMDGAHARLIEWPRSVLPAQLASAAACWTARNVLAGDRVLGVRTLDVILATCNAVVVHGVVGFLHVLACIVLHHAAYKAVASSPKGSTRTRRVCAWTSCLCVLLACDWAESASSSRPGSEEERDEGWRAFAARGWYGRGSFTHWKALRLTALRIASHGLAQAELNESPNLLDLIGYAMYPPLYQCGPMLPYESFRRWRRRRMSGNEERKRTKTNDAGDARAGHRARAARFAYAMAQVALWCVVAETFMQVGYRPSLVLAGAPTDFLNVLAHVFVFLTMTWATSHVVFGAPWAVACFVDGVASTPHDTPVFWTESSASFRRHWSSFHASLHRFYLVRVFEPLGSGHVGALATVALSVLMHGTRPHWIAWGIMNFVGLTAERMWSDALRRGEASTAARGRRGWVFFRVVAAAANRTVAVTSALVATALSARRMVAVVCVVFAGSLAGEVWGDGIAEAGALAARVESLFS